MVSFLRIELEVAMLKNLSISCTLVDEGELDLDFNTGRELIHHIFGKEINPTPEGALIQVLTEDGQKVSIGISYNDEDTAFVKVEKYVY